MSELTGFQQFIIILGGLSVVSLYAALVLWFLQSPLCHGDCRQGRECTCDVCPQPQAPTEIVLTKEQSNA